MYPSSDYPRSNLQWVVSLDTEAKPEINRRKSSIIGTIGPKSNSVETLIALRKAGLNIARMNFSHGSYEYHQSVVDNCRESVKQWTGRGLAIALDTKGPEIRTGMTKEGQDWPISAGSPITVTTDETYANACDASTMYLDYKNITKVVAPGRPIFVDDGILQLIVKEIVNETTIKAEALNSGMISSKKGVNLPGSDVDLPALSEKDKADLGFGVKNNVDMVFASFIRSGDDVKHIRDVLVKAGDTEGAIKIISKIENHQGVRNFDDILKYTDGVMVARGDLGIEIPAAEVFLVQKQMIAKCNLAGKPVICATQMLESMIVNPRPTRAEVSDVGNAVLDGADCVMLSGETAKGKYPVEAVSTMRDTALLAETTISYRNVFNDIRELTALPTSTAETVAIAAVSASFEQRAGAIVVLSTSGNTARLCSKFKPLCPIIMITRNDQAARQANLSRGVYPFVYNEPKATSIESWQNDVEERIRWGIEEAIKLNIMDRGSSVVTIQGWKSGHGHSNTLRIVNS